MQLALDAGSATESASHEGSKECARTRRDDDAEWAMAARGATASAAWSLPRAISSTPRRPWRKRN
ncbi:hypothetical protein ACFQ0G_12255 [Streptomyces chiangmaiensis]